MRWTDFVSCYTKVTHIKVYIAVYALQNKYQNQTEKSLTVPLYSLSKAVKLNDMIASFATFWMPSCPTRDVPYPNFAVKPSTSEPDTVPIFIFETNGATRYISTMTPFVWWSYEMSSWAWCCGQVSSLGAENKGRRHTSSGPITYLNNWILPSKPFSTP